VRKLKTIAVLLTVTGVFFGCTRKQSNLGEQFFNQGEYQQAIKEYNRVLAIKPRDVEVMYNRGRAY